jgi:excinuclease UvrABC helicase subunit UvrB
MKDLFALLLSGDLFTQSQGSLDFPKDDDPNWSKSVESHETKTHIIKKETWTSKDGSTKMERFVTELKQKVSIGRLKRELKMAVDKEDYEKAAELRDKIKDAEK